MNEHKPHTNILGNQRKKQVELNWHHRKFGKHDAHVKRKFWKHHIIP